MRALWVAAVVAAACANASNNTDNQTQIDAPSAIDAKKSTADAPPQHPNDAPPANIDAFVPDAFVPPIDAFVPPPPPDASTDGNLCSMNSQCTDQGECCLSISGIGFCAPGTAIGTVCLPN